MKQMVNLFDGQDHKWTTTCRFDDHCHKKGVDGAEVGVVCTLRCLQSLVAGLFLEGTAKNMPKFRGPNKHFQTGFSQSWKQSCNFLCCVVMKWISCWSCFEVMHELRWNGVFQIRRIYISTVFNPNSKQTKYI